MSRMQPVVFHPKNPVRRPTEEELKEFDEDWKMLCEGKSICITDPSKSGKPIASLEELKNPNRVDPLFIDCNDDISYEDFYTRLLNVEHDEK